LELPAGALVHMEAAPDSKGEFEAWSGACAGTGLCDLALSSDAVASATFRERKVALAVTVSGQGTIRSSPAGLDCNGTCSSTFAAGTRVRLEAIAADGFAFSGFGGSCNGMVCELDLSEAKAVSASFAVAMDTLTVRIRGDGRGRVISAPTGIDCRSGATCSYTFPRNSGVRLQAVPDAISQVEFWSGLCPGEPCTLKIRGDGVVDVSFALRRYTLVDLGAATGDWWSNASAISATGEIVAGTTGGRPVIFTPGLQGLGLDRGYVVGVNSSRMVAGNHPPPTADANPNWRPFRWFNGVVADLPSLPGGAYGVATAMSESGTVVGYSLYSNGPQRAVFWNDSGAVDLGSLGEGWMACSTAFGINRAGVIVGQSCTPFFNQHASRFRAPGAIDDLGTLGGNQSRASGINDAGDIVGFSDLPQGQGSHGFFWRDGTMTDAGALPGQSYSQLDAVNNRGVAVGLSHNNNQWPMTATLYLDGRIVALNDLVDDRRGAYVMTAAGIDDANVVVGTARIFGSDRAVLLRTK
jgi:probable HAF family extracellular repeat protein